MKWPSARAAQPVDEFIDSYVCWREACDEVRIAYARWGDCPPERREHAFKSYLASLEREEHAATIYSGCTRALRS